MTTFSGARLAPRLTLLLATLGLYSACASDDDPVEAPRTSGVAGQAGTATEADWEINQQNARLGRGINLGNCLDAPKEGDWGATLSEVDFEQAETLGFNSVRIPVRWSTHIAAEAPYQIDAEFLARVDWAVEQAYAHHLKAVIDVHHFTTLMDQPTEYAAVLKSIWRQLAEHYSSHGPELYFELLNEPNNQLTEPLWNEWVNELIPTIRQSNPKRSIIVGGTSFNSIAGLSSLELPADPYLIATFHFYEPQEFVFQGLSWVSGSDAWVGTKWYGSEGEVKVLDARFQQVLDWQKAHQRPIYLGEFGTGNKSDLESRVRYTAYLASYAESHAWSHAIWDDHGAMGLTNRDTGELITGIVEAIFDAKDVFAATRIASPPVTLPTGPSVLLDNFDDAFGDTPIQTYLRSAEASATGSTAPYGGWYCYADPKTAWVGINDAPLVTYETYLTQGTPMNMEASVGNVGSTGNGLRFAGQLANNSSYGGVGVEIQGDYGVDWTDLTMLTAVSFRAKGTGILRMSLVSDYCLNHYVEGQNWGQLGETFTLGSDWSLYVANVADLVPSTWSPAATDKVSWAQVRDRVTAIEFNFPGDNTGPVEVNLDDIRLHGLDYTDFGFTFAEPE